MLYDSILLYHYHWLYYQNNSSKIDHYTVMILVNKLICLCNAIYVWIILFHIVVYRISILVYHIKLIQFVKLLAFTLSASLMSIRSWHLSLSLSISCSNLATLFSKLIFSSSFSSILSWSFAFLGNLAKKWLFPLDNETDGEFLNNDKNSGLT